MDTPWPKIPLGDITTSQYGLSIAATVDGTVPILGMKNLQDGSILLNDLTRVLLTSEEIEKYRIQAGDILFNRTNSFDLVGKTSLVEITPSEPTVFASYLVRLKVDEDRALPQFVNYFLNSPCSERRLKDMATPGVSQFNINPTLLRKHFQIPLPSLAEQAGIVRTLQVWDRGIRQLANLIIAKTSFKQGLTQQLLSGKRRFREFSHLGHVHVRLQDVLEKATEPLTPATDEIYQEIGIRSHGKGIFHKEQVPGKSLGNKRVFRVLPGCLTLNIVFAWERALAVTSEREAGMIASHRFPMFRPDSERVLAEFVLLYLLSQKGLESLELASPGGAGRNRTLSQTQFLKTSLPLPSIGEQRKIVALVETAEREINLLRRQLEALKLQKKGLMQKLLNGEVRVKLSEGVA